MDKREEHQTHGHISPEPGKPCKVCASIGRLTWLDDDETCRREDVHPRHATGSQAGGES